MKKIIISGTGFPGTTQTLQHLQDGYTEPLGGIATWLGDFVILSGIEKIGNTNTYTKGFVVYGGEIIPFTHGTFNPKVSLMVNTQKAYYDSDANQDGQPDLLDAYQEKYFQFGIIQGATAVLNFSQFKRVLNWTQTKQKLDTIEQNAQKNVIPNWNQYNYQANDFIKNKPFRAFKITTGMVIMSNLKMEMNGFWNMENNAQFNCAFVSPPSGFSVYNLLGFLPAINLVKFPSFPSPLKLWCRYFLEHSQNRIRIYSNVSNNQTQGIAVNYIAIWATNPDNVPPSGAPSIE